ncbi:MAG: head decoration protein [Proteobacteria bacterium]|nr:head decoration protein [Pseudomonadota bacterium]
MAEETYTPKNLLGGAFPQACKSVTVLSGQSLAEGAVLGEITKALGAVAPGANTGNGTCTGTALKKNTKLGNYVLTCITAAANGGTFKVVDPDGFRLNDATVAVAYANDSIGFTINDGATDFIVGDSFTIPVAAGSKKCKLVDKTAVDGSQNPVAILKEAVDATAADASGIGAETGEFNIAAISLAAGTVAADVIDALAARNIYLRTLS